MLRKITFALSLYRYGEASIAGLGNKGNFLFGRLRDLFALVFALGAPVVVACHCNPCK